ncbi:MAG TPA: ribose-5-phosphate isomerase RpiA [Chlamydiales bacterium]|jgi:ribose 5-phosphate isomerase A|nr:ribose-5-phosphate isomerase RpiA [Chlamydiales bacterium]
MSIQEGKRAAGRKAAEWIQNGQTVGLGTGSTASCFLESLIERCALGLQITAVSSSHASAEQARQGGLNVLDINEAFHIDITVDGADEIDSQKRMIKGGGGAHVREKILASASDEMVVIVDETKLVPALGRTRLPVEILFYGSPATRRKLEDLGYQGRWRLNEDKSLFITENGNLLFDIAFASPPPFPEQDHEKIIHVPGVVDTGFFFGYAGRVIVGYSDGSVKVIE